MSDEPRPTIRDAWHDAVALWRIGLRWHAAKAFCRSFFLGEYRW